MAKFTRSWPSARMRRPISAETSASVRPTRGISPACNAAATRSTPWAAWRRASISAVSLTARIGPTISARPTPGGLGQQGQQLDEEAGPGLVADGDRAGRTDELGGAGHRVVGLPQPSILKMSGRGITRGTSRPGTNMVASASAGTTSIVNRSSGMASYPVSHGRSAPTDRSTTSTAWARMAVRTRSSRSTKGDAGAWLPMDQG
jgi:hypothetical protein